MKKIAYTSDGNGGVMEIEIDVPDEPVYIPKLVVVDRLEALGKRLEVKQAIASDDYINDRWQALSEGVEKNDTQVRGILVACGVDPDLVLY